MASRREKAPDKRMRRIALVICEGETEENYINLLKRWYKSPVRIVSHVEGTKINQSLVERRTKELKISALDKVDLKSASNLNDNLNCSKELEHYAS